MPSRLKALAAAVPALAALSCATAAPTIAPPPAMLAPVPDDVDVALRLDLRRLGAELGDELLHQLLVQALVADDDEPASALVDRLLSRAELAWLGLVAGPSLQEADKVVVMRGHFAFSAAPAATPPAGWTARPVQHPPRLKRTDGRGSPGTLLEARWRDERALVVSSAAQLPGVTRWLTGQSDGKSLHPPDRGALSLEAHPQALLRHYLRPYPRLAGRFATVQTLRGYVEPGATHVDAQLQLDFDEGERAVAANAAVTPLIERLSLGSCALAALAQATRAEVFGSQLRVVAHLDAAAVATIKSCLLTGICCV